MDDIYFSTLFAFDWPRLGIKFIKSMIHLLLQAEGCRVARKQRYDHRVSFMTAGGSTLLEVQLGYSRNRMRKTMEVGVSSIFSTSTLIGHTV